MTRVLRVVSSLGVGGVQKQLLSLVKHLDKDKVSVDILAVRRSGELEEEFSRYCKVKILNLQGKYNPLDILKLARAIKEGGYQIVHIHRMEDIVPMTVAASLLMGVKNIVIHHHFPYKWMSKRKLLIEKLATQRAKKVIGVSHFVASYMSRKMALGVRKSQVIYNGAVLERTYPLRAKKDSVGLVARLVNFKRIEDFIEASQRVVENRRNVEFLVVGDGEDKMREKLMKRAWKAGVEITWLGRVKDAQEIIEGLKIGVLSSSKEGLGNVILEYMASGALPVATQIPPVEETLLKGKTGYLILPKSPKAMGEAILMGLDNCAQRKKTVLSGQRRVQHFSIEKTAQKTLGLYESLIENPHI